MNKIRKQLILLCLIGLMFPLLSWAAATVQTVSGDVRVQAGGREDRVAVNQRIDPGASVITGETGQVMLRFDDGQQVALNSNTSFKVDEFRFDAAKPEQGSSLLSLVRGSLRYVTGLIGQRNRDKVALRTPNATIGIRGTDFMVAQVNPTFLSVVQGAVAASNTAGTVAFAAGATGSIASAATLATSIAASALPAAVSASFAQLGALPMTGAVGATGASGASGTTGSAGGATGTTGGAAGSAGASAGGAATGATAGVATGGAVGIGTVGAVAAGVAAVAAAASTTTTTTTHTTTSHH